MKITVDAHATMKSSVAYVLDDLDCPPVEIELTDDPNDYLNALTKISNEYKEEFIRCIEIEFMTRLSQHTAKQLTEQGIHIISEDS